MEFITKRVDHIPRQVLPGSRGKGLSLYNEAPSQELTLDEFELVALDRLQLLRAIESCKAKGYEEQEFKKRMEMIENKYMPILKSRDSETATSDFRRDQISHFILRLAYCRTHDLRQWFLEQEISLFKYRLDKIDVEERKVFMSANGLDYDVIHFDLKDNSNSTNILKEKLVGLGGITEGNIYTSTIYKIPFMQAVKLLSGRSVYLEGGWAFVPLRLIQAIIVMKFRGNLSHALSEAAIMFDIVSSDTRIGPLLKNMNTQYVGRDFNKTSSTGGLTPDMVDSAADVHMPLCMKSLQATLNRDHKLKHWGRLQYGLFLKGAGLDLEGALAFWQSHFGKVMSGEQFTKDYAYSFRHMYGKEGARKNYTPFSCMKIILGPPPVPGTFFGCPYKHMGDSQLVAQMSLAHINTNDAKEMMQLRSNGHYQVACQKHFEIFHPGYQYMDNVGKQGESVANHPNGWYLSSVQYAKAKEEVKETSSSSSYNSHSKSFSTIHNSIDGNANSGNVNVEMEIEDNEVDAAAVENN